MLDVVTKKWLSDCRRILSLKGAPIGAVTEQINNDAAQMVLIDADGKAMRINGSSVKEISADELTFNEISALAIGSVCTSELNHIRSVIVKGARNNELGMFMYDEMMSVISTQDYDVAIKEIEKRNKQSRNCQTIIGACIALPAANNYAHYMVTGIQGDKVRVHHLPIGDAYFLPSWGSLAWVDKEFVDKVLNWEKRAVSVCKM